MRTDVVKEFIPSFKKYNKYSFKMNFKTTTAWKVEKCRMLPVHISPFSYRLKKIYEQEKLCIQTLFTQCRAINDASCTS